MGNEQVILQFELDKVVERISNLVRTEIAKELNKIYEKEKFIKETKVRIEKGENIEVGRLWGVVDVATCNCLGRGHICTLKDLLGLKKKDLLAIRCFGKKRVEELIKGLKENYNIDYNDEQGFYTKNRG